MRRYFIESTLNVGEEFEITGDLFHHIFDVCRQTVGEHFELTNSQQKAYLVEVIGVAKKSGTVVVKEERQIPQLQRPHIHIALSIPRYPTLEVILEKSVELGVKSVHPLFSDHSFVRTISNYPKQKEERWKKIIQGATQQSGRGDLMEFKAPVRLEDFLKSFNRTGSSAGLFAYEGVATRSIKSYLNSVNRVSVQDLWLFVGSEGGFSASEVEKFKQLDLEPVTLGEQVLRVETACVTLVSVLKYEFDLLG